MGLGDIERIVRTVYRVTDSASGPTNAILAIAQRAASTLAAPITMVVGAVGVGAVLQQLTQVSAAYEDTMGAIAGTLSGLGLAGSGDPLSQFNTGLTMAAGTMDAITRAAAVLPGEASDYISVFRDGLPVVRSAIGGTLEQMYGFTNRMTAVGSALRVPAELIGRDIQDMLAPGRGHASIAQTQMFKALLPFMKQLRGHANLTAESFNRLSETVRGQLVSETLAAFDPMLANASHTFGAMAGALKSTVEMFVRLGGAPLFEEIKTQMGWINGLFFDTKGTITSMGSSILALSQLVSTKLATAFRRVGEAVQLLPAVLTAAYPVVNSMVRAGEQLFRTSGAGALASRAGAAVQGASRQQQAVGGATLLGPGLGALVSFATHTTALTATISNLASTVVSVASAFGSVWAVVTAVQVAIGSFLAGALPNLSLAVSNLASDIAKAFADLQPVLSTLLTNLTPVFSAFGEVVGAVGRLMGGIFGGAVRGVATQLAAFIRWLAAKFPAAGINEGPAERSAWQQVSGAVVGWTRDALALGRTGAQAIVEGGNVGINNTLLDMRNFAAGMMGQPLEGGRQRVSSWHDRIRRGYADVDEQFGFRGTPATTAPSTEPTFLDGVNNAMTALTNAAAAARAAAAVVPTVPPSRQPHATTHNDFRGSRFDITQRFAEGFDPDRVAVAFVNDLERTANRRLSGGLEPLYAVGTQ
jgi:hypothetical protein